MKEKINENPHKNSLYNDIYRIMSKAGYKTNLINKGQNQEKFKSLL